MARRRPSLAADASYWAWWLPREGKAILALSAVAVFVLGVLVYALRQSEQPREEFDAVIVRFGNSASGYKGNRPSSSPEPPTAASTSSTPTARSSSAAPPAHR